MTKQTIWIMCAMLAAGPASAVAQTQDEDIPPGHWAQSTTDPRAADRAAIRAHIESIFQAFIDGDVDKIFATHSEDWRGFLENSRTPIRGIDEYMKANGIPWPRPAGASTPVRPPAPAGAPTPGYIVKDLDVMFYSADLAIANFIGDFTRTTGTETVTTARYRILDVYAKRGGHWIQAGSHTVIDPAWRAETLSAPVTVPPQIRQQILGVRDAVWRAYFANDRPALEKLVPEDAIAMNEGGGAWADRAAILAGAERTAASGAKLVRLEFPKTEMQVYGSGMFVVLYTTFLYELDTNGTRTTTTGRGTEMFVRRATGYVNVGWHLDGGK